MAILRAFSIDSLLVFLRGFIPIPPTSTAPTPVKFPAAPAMPRDERLRNFPEVVAFHVDHVSGRGRSV